MKIFQTQYVMVFLPVRLTAVAVEISNAVKGKEIATETVIANQASCVVKTTVGQTSRLQQTAAQSHIEACNFFVSILLKSLSSVANS